MVIVVYVVSSQQHHFLGLHLPSAGGHMDKIDAAGYTYTTLILSIPLDIVPPHTALCVNQSLYMLAQQIVDRQIHVLIRSIHKTYIIGNIRYRVKGIWIVLAKAGKSRHHNCLTTQPEITHPVRIGQYPALFIVRWQLGPGFIGITLI